MPRRERRSRTRRSCDTPRCARIPDFHVAVVAARHESQAVGAERGGVDRPAMSAQGEPFAAGLRVPDLHGAVVARRGESPAVRAERHDIHADPMARQHVSLAAVSGVPDPHRRIIPSRGDHPTVRAEAGLHGRLGEAAEDISLLSRGRVPYHDFVSRRGVVGGIARPDHGEQALSVGAQTSRVCGVGPTEIANRSSPVRDSQTDTQPSDPV